MNTREFFWPVLAFTSMHGEDRLSRCIYIYIYLHIYTSLFSADKTFRLLLLSVTVSIIRLQIKSGIRLQIWTVSSISVASLLIHHMPPTLGNINYTRILDLSWIWSYASWYKKIIVVQFRLNHTKHCIPSTNAFFAPSGKYEAWSASLAEFTQVAFEDRLKILPFHQAGKDLIALSRLFVPQEYAL